MRAVPKGVALTVINVVCVLMWTDYGWRTSQSKCEDTLDINPIVPPSPPDMMIESAPIVKEQPLTEFVNRLTPQSSYLIDSDEREFTKLAHLCTDKTTVHRYQHLYPTILHKFRHAADVARANGLEPPKFRLLEMGVGCNMGICVAGGMRLFRSYLPSNVQYHAFEFNMKLCRERYNISQVTKEQVEYLESHLCEGSSDDPEALRRCGERFGPFDIIVDDASHMLKHIYAAYNFWFPSPFLRPGGVYVMEDLQTQFHPLYLNRLTTEESMATHIADIMRWKLNLNPVTARWAGSLRPMSLNTRAEHLAWLTKSVMCVSEACAFEKMASLETYPRGFPQKWKLSSS